MLVVVMKPSRRVLAGAALAPATLDPRLSGVHGCRRPLPGGSGLGDPATACLPARLAPRSPDGYGHGSQDLRPSSPCLLALLDAVVPRSPLGSPCRLPYLVRLKASAFARSNARGFGGGATLRRQVQPRQPLLEMVVQTSIGLSIFDSRLGG